MTIRNYTKSFLALAALAMATLVTTAAHADLVAYFPLTDGTAGSTVTGADDIIDDAGHGITDGTANGTGDTWVFDATRGSIVLSTTEGNRIAAGTQDINLNDGFSWSLWANVANSNQTDTGGDSIIGTRAGAWHKLDANGDITNWNGGLSTPDLWDDTWHHIAYVGDTVDRRLYVDGGQVGIDTSVPDLTTNVNFEFGGSSQFSEDITGLMSDVAVWNNRLSEADITALANGTAPDALGAIPEPSSLAIVGLGSVMMLVRRRRG